VAALVLPELQKQVDAWPKPKDGTNGTDGQHGKDADPAAVAAQLLPELQKQVDAWPKPKDGKDGEHGKSVTVDDVLPAFELLITKTLLDFERRSADVLQRAIDRMPVPKDGKDGQDGLSIEDLQVVHDGDGNVTLRFARGEVAKEFTLRLPRFKDCGIYRDAEPYQQGDGVTWGGSFWIAQKDAPEGKPGTADSGWRLAVKAGRDGKSFDAPQPAPGPVRIK
jgi:integrin beta 3